MIVTSAPSGQWPGGRIAVTAGGLALALIVAAPAAADLCAGSENPAIVWITPETRFVDHGDGTVTDTVTGRMWMRCPLGQTWNAGACDGDADLLDWQSALQGADALAFAGFNDWRVPDLKEAGSIVERRCRNPAANATLFPGIASRSYWTSTPYAGELGNASYSWTVDFTGGIDVIQLKTATHPVRLLRGGP